MSSSNKTRAIVLRRTNYGEADRILQLLTPEGKLSVIAKGVRKEKSRLSGGIELFAISEVVINMGKSDIKILTSARLVHFYANILQDYQKMQFGYKAIKLISDSSEAIDSSSNYEILSEVFMGLESDQLPLALVETWFYVHYADLLGHELSLWYDIFGEKIIENQNYTYDIGEKSLRQDNSGELTSEHIKLLRIIASRQLKTIAQIGGINSIIADCRDVALKHAAV